jgi:hypothetical protein
MKNVALIVAAAATLAATATVSPAPAEGPIRS